MTTQTLCLRRMVELLGQAGIPYMLAGSMGSSFHGEPRATNDIDFVIAPLMQPLQKFLESLGVAMVQKMSLDRDYLRRWSCELGVEALLARLFEELARFGEC